MRTSWSMRASARALAGVAAVVVCAVPAVNAATAGAGVVAPWVHVSGVRFVKASGAPVILRGVDQEGGIGLSSEKLVTALHANVVRLVMPWSRLETGPPDGSTLTLDTDLLQRIDAQVSWYQAHGVNVLLDFHQFKWSPYFGNPSATGIPSWFYSDTRAGHYPPTPAGLHQAEADWWTDPAGRQAYTAFALAMVHRYSSHPNVLGYELFNEPATGRLGETHAATQAVVDWEAAVARSIQAADPSRAVFFMIRGGGDMGLLHAELSGLAGIRHAVLDMHSYYDGLYGTGFSADGEAWSPSWTATHNQDSLDYHGTEQAQEQNLAVAIERTRALGIPLFIGEWGVQPGDSGAAAYQAQMLDVFGRYGLSWTRWGMGRGDRFTLLGAPGTTFDAMGDSLQRALAAPAPASGVPPADDIAPALAGTPQAGRRLQVTAGLWAGVPAPRLTYQWLRCTRTGTACVPIAGATSTRYVLTAADLGSTIRAAVTAASPAGRASAVTAPSAPIAA